MALRRKSQFFSIATMGVAAICFMGIALQLTIHSRERLLRAESIEIAKQWYDRFGGSAGTFEKIFDDGAAGSSLRKLPDRSWLSGIFYYEIHHRARGQIYKSHNDWTGEDGRIAKINRGNAEAGKFAPLRAKLLEGAGQGWPDVYSETVLPMVRADKRIGSIVVYGDQTARAALYKRTFGFLTSGLLILMAFGSALAGSIIAKKIREHQRAENRVRYLAHHDPLTDVLNRASFNEALEKALSESNSQQEDSNHPTLMWVDLDKFKEVNDSFGHALGDALLKYVAEKLQESADPGDLVARVGGDEFAILCLSPRSRSDLEQQAKSICERLNAIVCIDSQFVPCGACIGIASVPDAGTTAIQLVQAADLAMYNAKTNGRHGYRFYDPKMQDEAQARRDLEQALVRAIENSEFQVHYQPQVNLDSKEVEAYEALVRWNHPDKGTIQPADFIPVAEDTGLIEELGEWVLLQACKDAANWSGGERVAVNLSAAQFKDDHVLKAVSIALEASGLAPERLELEITESLLFHDPEKAMATLTTLKGLGVRVAMDDFGTGYSSLAHLWRFPFDKIKIDRSFVKNIEHNPKVDKIITSIIDLGRSLGITITAEGVEHEHQARFLRDRSCESVQGFFYGRPTPNAELGSLLKMEQLSDEPVSLPVLMSIIKQVESVDTLPPEAGVKILKALAQIAETTDEGDERDTVSAAEPDQAAVKTS